MQKLRKINISWNCGVDQKGTESLRHIRDIICGYNEKITDLDRTKT
jgi:hypothetical protein